MHLEVKMRLIDVQLVSRGVAEVEPDRVHKIMPPASIDNSAKQMFCG
jgi:hypothetical protein